MPYSILCIKAYGDRSNPEFYPQIDERGHFVVEPGDHAAVSADFTNLLIKQNSKTVFESEHGLDGKLFITDSRVVLMCEDYESGQFLWIGNPIITAIAGAASAAAAKSRTAGTVLTGHVRYEWVESVVPTSEKLLLALVDEALTINYRDPYDNPCSLTVSLKNVKGLANKLSAEVQGRIEKLNREHLGTQHRHELPAIGSTTTPANCTQCGKQIKEQHTYCKFCGTKQR